MKRRAQRKSRKRDRGQEHKHTTRSGLKHQKNNLGRPITVLVPIRGRVDTRLRDILKEHSSRCFYTF